jgi:hypothetical protein
MESQNKHTVKLAVMAGNHRQVHVRPKSEGFGSLTESWLKCVVSQRGAGGWRLAAALPGIVLGNDLACWDLKSREEVARF